MGRPRKIKLEGETAVSGEMCEACNGTGRGVPPTPSTVSACLECEGSGLQ